MKYQELQKQHMDKLETYTCSSSFPASVVVPVEDYANDTRKYLTIIAHPTKQIVSKITSSFVADLKKTNSKQYFCEPSSLHLTILSIQLFHDGGNFSQEKIDQIVQVTKDTFAAHRPFMVKMKGTLALPTSIGIRCYTTSKLRTLVQHLKEELQKISVISDKKLFSEQVLFGNVTICRFKPKYRPSDEMLAVVNKYHDYDFGGMKLQKIKLVHANAVVSTNHTKVLVECNLA